MSQSKFNVLIGFISMIFIFSCKKENNGFSLQSQSVKVYTTSNDSVSNLKLTQELNFKELKQPLETQVCIFVEPDIKYQTYMGIGGAITDASAEVFAKLDKQKQEELLTAYFDNKKGIGYSIIRTNMNSCDFSSDSYTYVKENDKTLESFNIDHDRKFKIPLIKRALQKSPESKTFFSPWSPPSYMKSNNDMLHGGKLLPDFYNTWADYYVKYIKEYQKEGIDFWGMTIQNEPMATQIWESCIYTAEEERDFLKNYLGPTLSKNKLQSKKVIFWDHNRDLITQRANVMLTDKDAAKYVWGIGFHWYENWSGGEMMFSNVGEVNRMYPDKNLVFTEGCADSFNKNRILAWENAEKYGKSMINDFNNGTVMWTDWNILLDETGGPNHVGNFCFAPVHADSKSGNLIYTPSYYYIGHFSKFIKNGSQRISSVASRSQLLTTSFLNKLGNITTIVMNPTDKKITYFLCVRSSAAEVTIAPHSIQSLVF